ncbi:DUF3574 domain-containing protein [Pseudoxanthobacter sp. M-2]|uniref:DUF3574 domain-containing protein n=1 Tax=Pseudoxanthobacter sp. M-2 TaxID=3078754 RepID=UPI0038FD2B90
MKARPMHRFAAACLFSLAVCAAGATLPARAQDGMGEIAAVQTTLYFGLKSADGRGVSEQEWARFLAEVVTPRFPQGLTVVTAYGQGSNPGADAVLAELTKVLIVVHPDDEANAAKISEIKQKYSEDFGQTGVFHTEADVRIVP